MTSYDLSEFRKNDSFYGKVDLLLTVKSFDLQAIRKRYLDSKNNPNNKLGSFERRATTEGGVVQLSLEDGNVISQRILTKLPEPRGVDYHDGNIALSSENKVFVITQSKTYMITNEWFSYIHTVKFSADGDRIVVSSSGLDCLFEYDWRTGEQLRAWFAWDNGLNTAKTSESGQLTLTRHEQEAKLLQEQGKEVLYIKNPKEQVLPTAKRAAFINSVTYDADDNNYVLATLFHEGSVRRIDLSSGEHEIVMDGLRSPHGGMTLKGGLFMATNTRNGSVERIVEGKREHFDFSNLQGKPKELGDMEWLQNSVNFGQSIITIDSNRNTLTLFSPEEQWISSIPYDDNWAIQDVIPMNAALIPSDRIQELASY